MWSDQEKETYQQVKTMILDSVQKSPRSRRLTGIIKELKLTKEQDKFAGIAGRDLILEGSVLLTVNWKLKKVKSGS